VPSAVAIGAACRSQSSHCPALRPAAGGCTLCGPWCRVQPGLLRTCAAVAAPSMAPGRSRPRARRCLRRRGRPSACPHLAVTVHHVQGAARARAARHALGQGHARAHRGHVLHGATWACTHVHLAGAAWLECGRTRLARPRCRTGPRRAAGEAALLWLGHRAPCRWEPPPRRLGRGRRGKAAAARAAEAARPRSHAAVTRAQSRCPRIAEGPRVRVGLTLSWPAPGPPARGAAPPHCAPPGPCLAEATLLEPSRAAEAAAGPPLPRPRPSCLGLHPRRRRRAATARARQGRIGSHCSRPSGPLVPRHPRARAGRHRRLEIAGGRLGFPNP
jgi:hypothetical protein